MRCGPEGYGYMLSSFGVGALLAALLVASFGSLRRRGLFLGAGVLVTAAALAGLGNATRLPAGLLWATLAGAGLICFFVTAQSVMQLSATDGNRGRVMGVWSMITSGALPLGNLLMGWAGDRFGVGATLVAMGIAVVGIAALLALLALARRR
jgi:hypothetical protein